jgi:hypothetical protein
MSNTDELSAGIADAVEAHGLALRGGFCPAPDDGVPDAFPGVPARTVLMIGNAGRAMWPHFERERRSEPSPLDRWVARVIEPIAARHGARAVYPSDSPPLPFQRWAARGWPLHASPLGLLIDTEYGLWHALRAALLFDSVLAMPVRAPTTSPCESCVAKPCLTTCPVGAFTAAGFAYQDCRAYLAANAQSPCRAGTCQARAACPIGATHRYGDAQQRFHMAAFSGLVPAPR